MCPSAIPPFSTHRVETFDGKFIYTKTLEGTAWVKVWTKSLPEGKIFQIWLIADDKFILVDDKGKKWVYYPLYKNHPIREKPFWALSCSSICKCRRIHVTCSWCPYRRILTGGARNPIPCTIYLDAIPLDRNLSFLRKRTIQFLNSMKELVVHV